MVTSRFDPQSPKSAHYALVCYRELPFVLDEEALEIKFASLRNILTGRSVGASQVTSVVEHSAPGAGESKTYRVSFRSRLVAPYLIRLQDPLPVRMNSGVPCRDESWTEAAKNLWNRRVNSSVQQLALQSS